MVIATWGSRALSVDARNIVSMSALGLATEAETEDKESGGRTLKQFKSGGARLVTMDVPLMAALGADVRGEIESWMDACESGARAPLYISGAQVGAGEMLVRSVQVENASIGPQGQWKQATLKLEFAESSAGSSGSSSSSSSSGSKTSSGSSSKSKKASVKKAASSSGIIGSAASVLATGGTKAEAAAAATASAKGASSALAADRAIIKARAKSDRIKAAQARAASKPTTVAGRTSYTGGAGANLKAVK